MKTTSSATPARNRSVRARTPSAKSKQKAKSLSIFSEIKKDHATFRKAMDRIQKLYLSDPEQAKAAYSEFKTLLHAHSQAEEVTLYSTLLDLSAPGGKLDDQVREGREEHHVADFLMNELTQISAADPKWKAKFKVLTESVDHHLNEEEDNFAFWRKSLPRGQDQAVLAHFISRRSAFIAESISGRH